MSSKKEKTPKGITLIGRKKDSYKKFYEAMKPLMERIIKSLPTDKELQKGMKKTLRKKRGEK